MRYLIIYLWIIICPLLAISQTDTSNYKIVYEYKIKTGDTYIYGQQNIVLHSDKKAVAWNDLSGIPNYEGNAPIVNKGKSAKNQFVYKNFETNSLVFEAKTSLLPKDKTVFSDSLYPMQWEISGEESIIDSLRCLKATCFFRGRNYEAWFAPEIPIREGPWKFGGLPGLIILIQDSEGKYKWRFTSLTNSADAIAKAPASSGNFEEFKTLFTAGVKKMQESFKASGSSVDPSCVGCGQTASIAVELIERF
jgi:GLPGLI family protein